MNKSLEFVNKRLMAQGKETITEGDGISIVCFPKFFGSDSADFSLTADLKSKDKSISDMVVELKQAPEDFEDFDFYSSYAEHNDGTLLFVGLAVERILNHWASLGSYPISKIKTKEDLVGVKKIKIMVGDVIIRQQDDESPVAEKPWMTNKLEVFIPAYFELIKE